MLDIHLCLIIEAVRVQEDCRLEIHYLSTEYQEAYNSIPSEHICKIHRPS